MIYKEGKPFILQNFHDGHPISLPISTAVKDMSLPEDKDGYGNIRSSRTYSGYV